MQLRVAKFFPTTERFNANAPQIHSHREALSKSPRKARPTAAAPMYALFSSVGIQIGTIF